MALAEGSSNLNVVKRRGTSLRGGRRKGRSQTNPAGAWRILLKEKEVSQKRGTMKNSPRGLNGGEGKNLDNESGPYRGRTRWRKAEGGALN